jgi:sulfite reductase (NADPH) flavoprotein alpha-component
VAQLASEERLLVITSTYGDGEPPDGARGFWKFLNDEHAPKLARAKFSVCALGDTNYPQFCAFGKEVDRRLESLGAARTYERVDCDVDFEEPFAKWLNLALNSFSSGAQPTVVEVTTPAPGPESPIPKSHNRDRPFPAPLLTNRLLNGQGSDKDTRHFELDVNGAGPAYEAGDALGVVPTNCPELVEDVLRALRFTGEEPAAGRDEKSVPLREALLRHYEITKIPHSLLAVVAEKSGDDLLKKLTAPGVNGELKEFLRGRETIDLLLQHPKARFTPEEFLALLKRLQPRLYSISSSPKAHPGHVHLTVSVVRYQSHSRHRKGVCSTFLADRVPSGQPVPVFVHQNKKFRPPADGAKPMIMVGPGTGIAPFRAFLEERRATAAKGRNWLFFGDQRSATDFMYREELESMVGEGTLHRLDTAFSRDQAEKIYVQHRMQEHARELFAWLEEGAGFYVCGDAGRMAKDVEAMLLEVIQTAGGRTPEQAAEYLARLRAENRYQRDVY